MKLLKHIEDKPIPKNGKYEKRLAVRAAIFDKDGLMPILFVSKYNYHKLPGGGIEKGETKMQALERELHEETGCIAEINGEVGKIEEYRSKFNLFQTSFFYWGKIVTKGQQNLEPDEIEEGFNLVWVTIEEAVKKLKNDRPTNYEGKFIQNRDLAFLEEVKKSLRV